MQIEFKGTRGGIEERSRKHLRNSLLLVNGIAFDFGSDWSFRLCKPKAIFLTHAHPDHSNGLKNGSDIYIYLTEDNYKLIKKFKLKKFKIIKPLDNIWIGNLKIIPYKVMHSARIFTVGYIIKQGNKKIVYNPDLIKIYNPSKILKRINLYLSDGASLFKGIKKKKGNLTIGHASIKEQIKWCEKYKIKKAIFTHCGKEIVEFNEKKLNRLIKDLSRKVNVKIAYDGMKIKV